MEQQEQTNQVDNESADYVEKAGVDFALAASYAAVDKSALENKRDVLYSLVCFGCMFDMRFASDPDPLLDKYAALSAPEPQKLDLCVLVHTLVTLPEASDELKAMWYQMYPYVLLSGAPLNDKLHAEIKTALLNEKVFEAVLQSRYSVYVPAASDELRAQGYPQTVLDWYAPYQAYASERDEKGVTRETRECKRLLALGNFDQALTRAERLLAVFPDDEQVALTDIAARVSLIGVHTEKERTALLSDTLSLIDEYIQISQNTYFRYYRGLTLLGLMDTAAAREEFKRCLKEDPSFELAQFMLSAMDKNGAGA
ncbi:MAG: hypothetical protein K2M95_00895 [Clostridiales bacterium]|nr:hypothetical protein [Clostridiales bacterium]